MKTLALALLGALLWFAPWLAPGKALLGTHPALFRPFETTLAPAALAEVKRAAHPLYTDKLLQHDPEVRRNASRPFDLETWNPRVLGGYPQHATGLSSALHPLMWLAYVIPPPLCYAWIAVLQTALAAWFTFLMLRAFEVRPIGAAVGALLFAAGGWMTVHQEYFQLTAAAGWLPLAIYGARQLMQRRGGFVPLSVAIGGSFLSGFPQIAVYALLAAGLVVVVEAIAAAQRRESASRSLRSGGTAALAVAAGLLLAAPQLLPTAEFVRESTRQPLTEAILTEQALPAVALTGTFLPDLLGKSWSQQEIEEEEAAAAQEKRGARSSTLFAVACADVGKREARNNRFETGALLGAAPLLLALLGAFCGRRGARGCFLLLLATGLALSLRGPLLWASVHIPGLDIGDPKRALLLVVVALGALAALGVERIVDDALIRRRALVLFAVALLGFAAIAAGFAFGGAELLTDWAAPKIAASLGQPIEKALALARGIADDGRLLLTNQARGAALSTLLALVPLALLHFAPFSRFFQERRCLVTALLLAALTPPLWNYWRATTGPIPTADLDARPALLRHFERHPIEGRLLRFGPRAEMPPWPPKLPDERDVRDAQGYVAAYLAKWRDLFEALEPRSTETVGLRPLGDPKKLERPLLDLLDVEVVLVVLPAGVPAVAPAGFEVEPLDPGPIDDLPAATPGAAAPAYSLALLRNRESLGRAHLVRTLHLGATDAEIVAALVAPEFQPASEAWMNALDAKAAGITPEALAAMAAGGSSQNSGSSADSCKLVVDEDEALAFDVDGRGGLLVQSDCWYPGWTVTIDGTACTLLRVDHALRGVVVPPGPHRVEFRYVSRPLRLGLGLAAMSLLALIVTSRVASRRRGASAAPLSSAG